MKGFKWLFARLLLGLTILLAASSALADTVPDLHQLTYIASKDGASISFVKLSGGRFGLFLPSSADLTALAFHFHGDPAILVVDDQQITITSDQPFDLTALYPEPPEDGVYTFMLKQDPHRVVVQCMVSSNIASMYLISDDPENQGESYVDLVKGNKASGQVILLRADGSTIYAGDLKQIKGRGNTTWNYPKKPYQIKLTKKADLLETGDPDEANKTWILLANYYDHSLIRNMLTYDLAAELGLPYSPNCRSVDLYYDGAYRGTYLLCEKTEIGTGRIDIHDLEKDFEDANPQVEDFDALETAVDQNSYGKKYYYVTGLNDPEDISGGYLLEIDFWERANEEKSHFVSKWEFEIVVKSPEYASQNAMKYISEFYQLFEDAAFNAGINRNTGLAYTDYMDLKSLAQNFVIFELTQNGDAYRSSSFIYKPAGEDKLYSGPVWDYDTAYGLYYRNYGETELVAARTRLGKALMKIPSFCQAVEDIYRHDLNPLITEIVLSDDPEVRSGRLRSIASYFEELAASSRMNDRRWPNHESEAYEDAIDSLRSFIAHRNQFLNELQWDHVLEEEETP